MSSRERGDRRLTEEVQRLENEVGQPKRRMREIQHERAEDGEEWNREPIPPRTAAREQPDAGGPEREFQADVMEEEDAGGVGVKELLHDRNREVAPIRNGRGEGECPRGLWPAQTQQPRRECGDAKAEQQEREGHNWRGGDGAHIAQRRAAEHGIRDETRIEEIHGDGEQRAVGLRPQPAKAPQRETASQHDERRGNGTQQ